MDEVAFMVTSITDNGMIRFQPLGGWWNQVMLAQRVTVYAKEREIPGVIASIPPHLLTDAERAKPMDMKNMLIDIGADDKEDAIAMGVRPGQSIFQFVRLHQWQIRKKLWQKHGITVMVVDLRLSF